MNTKEELIANIEDSKTGNRSRDRVILIRKWNENRSQDLPFSEAVLNYLNNELDNLLPSNLSRFTKDMEIERNLWIDFLIERASQVQKGYDLERAYKLINLAITELEKNVDTTNDNSPVFSVDNLYEEELIRHVLNIPTKFRIVEGSYSEAYFILASIAFGLGREGEGVNALTTANHWNPVSVPILLNIAEYFKMRKVVDRMHMVSLFAAQIAIEPNEIGAALRLVGYSYYLQGKYQHAYACYQESFRFGDTFDSTSVNNEMDAILIALGEKGPKIMKKREVKELFLAEKFKPEASQLAFSTLKNVIRKLFDEKDYLGVIEYAELFLATKKDVTVEKFLRLAKEHLS